MSEAKKALSEMGSWEAPGPDGYQPGFFKHTWEITGQQVYSFAQAILNGGDVTSEDAKALLVLVPKVVQPSSLKNFIPISLCNVRLKLVSKMLAND